MWRGSAEKRLRAIELRRTPTDAEAVLWSALRRNALGLRVRRQVVIAGFIVDFVIPRAGLVVEVDGGVHEARAAYDDARDRVLNAKGFLVARVRNDDVLPDVGAVVARLRGLIGSSPAKPGAPGGGLPERVDLDPVDRGSRS